MVALNLNQDFKGVRYSGGEGIQQVNASVVLIENGGCNAADFPADRTWRAFRACHHTHPHPPRTSLPLCPSKCVLTYLMCSSER